MSESTVDAMVLISTSFQALKRAEQGDESTLLCDCTVVIVFASFFIEANLNQIIAKLGKTDEMENFLKYKPGLQDKLAWFYNNYMATEKAENKKQLKTKKFLNKLPGEFPGFDEIYAFRNNISHGVIDKSLANLENAERLRITAKEIVDKLFTVVSKTGIDIPRNITYEAAISRNYNSTNFKSFDNKFILAVHSSS